LTENRGLADTQSWENLKAAFARECQVNRRYAYFARRADIDGHPDIGGMFRDLAEGESAHAFGHLDFLKLTGDPLTGEPIGDTESNLRAAVAEESHDYANMYPQYARTARDEGLDELAEWFEALAAAERLHAGRLMRAIENLGGGQ
jgi:rubrerythrin